MGNNFLTMTKTEMIHFTVDDPYTEIFNHFSDMHGITLIREEMDEIINLIHKVTRK